MTWIRTRWLPLTILVAAVGLLITSAGWAARLGPRPSDISTTWHGGMMGPAAIPGNGSVGTLDDATRAATRFAERAGLSVGEVMQFDNGFYAELVDASGTRATEVLVDPRTGGVQVEFGPAMMWNTGYGMHPPLAQNARVDNERARAIADQWLDANRPGERAGQAEAFPGYYTLHTLRGDQVVGMLSVNASTGTVWFHSWHGRFIAMTGDNE